MIYCSLFHPATCEVRCSWIKLLRITDLTMNFCLWVGSSCRIDSTNPPLRWISLFCCEICFKRLFLSSSLNPALSLQTTLQNNTAPLHQQPPSHYRLFIPISPVPFCGPFALRIIRELQIISAKPPAWTNKGERIPEGFIKAADEQAEVLPTLSWLHGVRQAPLTSALKCF